MTCCRSSPRCKDCPVRLAARARSRAPRTPLTSLFDEIYRPARQELPDVVLDALLALSEARERYRLEHMASRASAQAPGQTTI